ncbi:HD domain-containing protein [Tuanshanicoccus lijuaniae]|uniref:HD domain-containing protein n=1 Tax=Aerococcaceae bacterium zg-1292 TaxID=2774330 RepID=UPI001BD83673|nr:HD domain-containing protein [Aerococcaceae bacterium zg-BR9]MBF6979277.1 HD domain-containing protein [Aerococcaceae bacterium zg-BR22]MBS4456929.1 HD domain-containing protein [Aerococcaceae bacterium zg-A91]MBS4458789.1 HD domain-containing protein [Aerococcaceae bacterium zg-BR33]
MSDFLEKVAAQKLKREKVFRDPVHGYIHIHDAIILKLIDTREFQRLRRIKQLGTSSFTFHGAEHSRFNHSLGVYEITRRIIDKFERQYPSVQANDGLWQTDEYMVSLCAALLHDIGHGPFSHTFEGIFNTDHEQLTQQIITSPETEINQVLRFFGDDFPRKVAAVINKTYPNQQVVQIISSQVDADRMDYLLRDAYYAGVSYGTFDLTRVLRVIRPYNNQITFDYSGMHAVEDYIVSRYQMYMQVYFHGVSRGMEQVLKSLLHRAKICYIENEHQMKQPAGLLKPFLEGNWTLLDYLQLDDHVMSTYFSMWVYEDDTMLSDLAYRFVNRKPFKSLIISEDDLEALSIALQEQMIVHGFDPEYYFGINSSFDLPYDYYRPNQNKQRTQIELLSKTNKLVELSQVSALVNSLAGKFKGDLRLYFPQELIEKIEQISADQLDDNQRMILITYATDYNDRHFYVQERLF